MKDYCVHRSALSGSIQIPSSKSHTIRALFYGAMAHGDSIVHQPLDSPDVARSVEACRALGAEISLHQNVYQIRGVAGRPSVPEDVIDVGNSGLALRFVSALSSLTSGYTVVTGDESIRRQRPLQPLIDGLQGLGAFVASTRVNGFAPLIIRGPICQGTTRLLGEDSQPVTALLSAAAYLDGMTEILVDNPGETPWVLLTLSWLDRLGVRYQRQDFSRYQVDGCGGHPGFSYTVPGDFSSAAFPLVAALITGSEITLTNLDMSDVQGDKKIIEVLRTMGARLEVDNDARSVRVHRGPSLQGMVIDINQMVDALPILAVLGCSAVSETRLINGAITRRKECDRIAVMARELRRMGAEIVEREDGLSIWPSRLHGAIVDSHQDHRIAMALTIAGMVAHGTSTQIRGVGCVSKTYPSFFEQFRLLGADLELLSLGGHR